MRYDIPPEKYEEQIERERIQRETALGRRFDLASGGHLGPVISRWINAAVHPIAHRTRTCAEAYCRRDMLTFGRTLDTKVFGLAAAYDTGSPEYLEPILKWTLRGSSPGRQGGAEATYAEDLVFAIVGRTISDLAQRSLGTKRNHGTEDVAGLSLAMVLSNAAAAARETALGQFIQMVQGADAMKKIRRWDRSSWSQRNSMGKVARILASQVRHALEMEAKGEITLEHVGARTIVKVIDPNKINAGARQISLKADDLDYDSWKLLELAVFPKGEEDPGKNAWLTFAMMVLCAAQVEHGWFDLANAHAAKHLKGRKPKGQTRYLVLSEKPRNHLKSDLAKWIDMGFAFEPMIVPPENGAYLTVKTRAVTGRNGPHGWRTHGENTTAWQLAGDVMAATPWQVAKGTLEDLQTGDAGVMDLAMAAVPDELVRRLIVTAYAKESSQPEIYLPLYMDFRGRIYPRTSWVTYQGNDLQKGLLQFTPSHSKPDEQALALHVTSLMGFDKKALPERLEIFKGLKPNRDTIAIASADEPIQLWTAMRLLGEGRGDQIPVQIDGTCNGLQHLSALFRDEQAAPWVNLDPCSYNEPPSDLYAEVATASRSVVSLRATMGEAWAMRFMSCGARIDRSVVKRPVMVLPYGGTVIAIEEGVTAGLLAQQIDPRVWLECLKAPGELDPDAIANGYKNFSDRPLHDHPLFKRDVQRLSQVVHGAIRQVIPKAMAAMDAFRAIAGKVGDRSLEWSNGVAPDPMWIVHAYPKSERRTSIFRGFHLPNSVRGLAMKCGRDEINPTMHRTGIVANFIHSQDAAHLVETMRFFDSFNAKAFGANHDCLYTRSSEAKHMGAAVRSAFVMRYGMMGDPLSSPVRLRSLDKVEEYPSWYALADAFGVQFPERGKWKPEGVLKSAWFFS